MPFDEPGFAARYGESESLYIRRLCAARETLARPGAWIRGNYAAKVSAHSYDVIAPTDADANCFCIMGALQRAWGTNSEQLEDPLKDPEALILGIINKMPDPFHRSWPISEITGYPTASHPYHWASLPGWNDDRYRSVGEVLDVLDSTIAYARQHPILSRIAQHG